MKDRELSILKNNAGSCTVCNGAMKDGDTILFVRWRKIHLYLCPECTANRLAVQVAGCDEVGTIQWVEETLEDARTLRALSRNKPQ